MKFLVVLFFLCLVTVAVTADVDLFSAAVPLQDDSPEARRQAMGEALYEVLVKASGSRLSRKKPELAKMLERAEDHVQEFRYLTRPPEEEGGEPRKLLWARFDRNAVSRMLRDLGVALWEGGRPELMLWLAVDQQGKRRLADPEKDAEMLEAARAAAERRGLTLVLPLMDLQDRNTLSAPDLWVGDLQAIGEASARYGQAVPLAVRLRQQGSKWEARWLMLLPDGEQEFRSGGGSLESVLDAGIAKAVGLLAGKYVPSAAGDSQVVRLRFLDVQDLAQYAQLQRLLRSLDVVSSARLLEAQQDRLLFEVGVSGGIDVLENQLSLQAELSPVVEIPDDGGEGPSVETLSYSLR